LSIATTKRTQQMTRHRLLPSGPFIALALIVAGPTWAQEAGQLGRTPAITATPEYPDAAIRDRLEGETTVCFGVDSRGRVIRPNVRSSTNQIFDRPAIKAIRASKFEPLLAVRGHSPSALCRIYLFDLDALEVAEQSTEREAPFAVTSASFTASERLLAPPAGLATSGVDVVSASAEANVVVPDVNTVPLYEEGGETVCRDMTRPGSRISETVCYTRAEELASQAASNRTVADLAREQQWREQAIHEAAMRNRVPGVVGMSR
jgi:TonB family protein